MGKRLIHYNSLINETLVHLFQNYNKKQIFHECLQVKLEGMDMNHMNMDGTTTNRNMDSATGMDMSAIDMMMASYYHLGYKEFILFYDIRTLSAGAMVGACFVIFTIAVLYEGIKFLRDYLQQRLDSSPKVGVINSTLDNPNPFISGSSSTEKLAKRAAKLSSKRAIFNGSHFLQTILHMIQIFVSYCLMLIVMTFNVWLISSVVVGAGNKYFYSKGVSKFNFLTMLKSFSIL
ncbi:hypothetical protein Btru_062328 [Bulinus truncatus]|nr:hypothetical protein Btru_062328 [Bulinus truncatus]